MKIKIFIQRLTTIISILLLFAAMVFGAITLFTEYNYKWLFISASLLFIISIFISIFIDTRTPEEKIEDAKREQQEKEDESKVKADQTVRILEANEKYNGDLCQVCNAGMSFCDTCSNYSQFQ